MQFNSVGPKAFPGISTSVAKKAVKKEKTTQDPKDSVSLSKRHSDDGELSKMKKLQDMRRAITASSSKSEKSEKGKDAGEAKETEKKSEEKFSFWKSVAKQALIDRAKTSDKINKGIEKLLIGE